MKLKYLFSMAMAGFLFGACSSDDVVVGDGGQDGAVAVQPGEEGFLSMSINLPTTVGVKRVAGYDDGTPDEYQVNSAKLLVFSGESEAAATLHRVYDLDVSAFTKNDETQITSSANIVQDILVPPTVGQQAPTFYAMVVLNDNGLLPGEGDASGTEFHQKTFKEVSELAKDLNESSLRTHGGKPSFFMSNAPMYSVAGGTTRPADNGKVTTLAEIDQTKIFQTELEARQNPAVTVYVERALAKVTVKADNDNLSGDANENLVGYTVSGWTLDNTNKSTYLVRNVAPENLAAAQPAWWQYNNAESNYYRFVDVAAVETGVSFYRTHFGIDPNNAVDNNYATGSLLNKVAKTIPAGDLTPAGETPRYCLENTFDVKRMTEQNTTRVIVAATLEIDGAEGNGDFYLLNKNTATIYQKSGVENEVKRLWMNYFQTIISTYVKNGKFTEDNVTVTLSNATGAAQANGGYTTVTGIVMDADNVADLEYQEGKGIADINAAAAAYLSTLNDMLTISYYKGGVAYYPVLIKHFGNTETPWTMPTGGVLESYPGTDAANNWLGRYGVLRNTWYTVNVTGLKNIGFCEVPDAGTRYDDPLDQYIAVEIHILPWATRSQDVEL